ncbi:THO complex subunit 5 [Coemansia thaxteri]|uniref:THO complex subunit 5 n=1 Tax=Coemansia thaxteri TaxID=2663907 RepID=A0A9W8BCH6_9FUNG|nr:THO complex subunit 5 [Coemansia thaxteri]KAJ1998165.1 THO complex subunit 5 [Coemansia thaxteri]KAJ2464544.1 THO complex subunit 5 [Coemansia sp. RSA 2322]KAJ2482176.1 THO complex subunit 5 [Coemansia sp. RSA 2320]
MDSDPSEASANTQIGAISSEIEARCDIVERIAVAIASDAEKQQLPAGFDSQQDVLHAVTSTFVSLRMLNRQLHENRAALNASVAELKQKTDSLALELENKQSEVQYIQKEIDTTRRQETIYQTIDLISEQEFLEAAPEEFKADIDTPHKLMLNRLRYEVKQRDMQIEVNAEARARRDELRQAKRKRIEKLEKMDGHLQSYIKTIAVLGRSLGITGESAKEVEEGSNDASEDVDMSKESKRVREIRGETGSRMGSPRA